MPFQHQRTWRALLILIALIVLPLLSDASKLNSTADPASPQIAWLLSFPNSGTTYTLQAVHHESSIGIGIAANTCLKWVHRTCRPVFEEERGPYFISNSATPSDSTVLTRTHCAGHYTFCGPISSSHFQLACRQTAQIEPWGWKSHSAPYSTELKVYKAIHLWRNPFDNIVARWRHAQRYVWLPSFRLYCTLVDFYAKIVHRHKRIPQVPCFSEFARYIQWHNHAVAMEESNPTMQVLHTHYEDYGDGGQTLDSVLQFLGGTSSNTDTLPFVANKTYSNYYTPQEQEAIRQYLRDNASGEVWEHLQRYWN